MKKILLITTGGTIASSDEGEGLTPDKRNRALSEFIKSIEDVELLNLMSLDSTNIGPEEIIKIAEAVQDNIGKYDGFVITHGTDTMAYSASALSYLLEEINVPVILTGSQIPLERAETDAKENLLLALDWARDDIRGIFIAFNGKLIRGNRAYKIDSLSKEAFVSPNFPTDHLLGLYCSVEELEERKLGMNPNVFLLKLYPGIDEKIFDFIKDNYNGLVIEAYGLGGIPSNLVEKIKELLEEGTLVALSTQCLIGGVKGGVYAVGSLFDDPRIIDGRDMTSEALVMKMMVALDRYIDKESQKKFMETSIESDRNEEI